MGYSLLVDSRDRHVLSTSTTNFKLDFGIVFSSISEVELVNCSIPIGLYIFNSSNNVISFTEGIYY